MIKNEKQYQVTLKKLVEFQKSLQNLYNNKNISYEEISIRAGFIESHIDIFKDELQEYEDLRAKRIHSVSLDSLQDLSDSLIKARIAKGWTQAELAQRLGLKEQQIQRYESTDYETASLARIIQIFNALQLNLIDCRIIIEQPNFLLPKYMQKSDFDNAVKRLHSSHSLTENLVA